MENESRELKVKLKYISILAIFEMVILFIGVLMSIRSTTRVLKYDFKYAGYYAFALLGLAFIAILILLVKKKYAWIIGLTFIIVFLIVGGFADLVCEANYSRLKKVNYYKGKTITAEYNGNYYEWDGESYFFYRKDMVLEDHPSVNNDYKLYIDGEESKMCIYTSPEDTENIYIEIFGGDIGAYLILAPESQE